MSSLTIAVITCVCLFAGVLAGSLVRSRLPGQHLRDESKDALTMGTALIGTLTALILGLMISSSKSSFDSMSAGVTQGSAKMISLDRVLARYGPETQDARVQLKHTVASIIERNWPEHQEAVAHLGTLRPGEGVEGVHEKVLNLTPQNESQKWLRTQALQIANDLAQLKWQLVEEEASSLPPSLLVVLTFGLTVLFASFGLFAPRNFTVMTVLLLCALSVSGAVFIMMEMDLPLDGLVKVSDAPLLDALGRLGQ